MAVAGAGGYVGARLVDRLTADGHQVRVLGRRPGTLPSGPGVARRVVDVGDPGATGEALAGAGSAYYLVHAMAGGEGFAARDRALARSFAEAAAESGVGRIVYLGGLGDGDLSAHLASRHEVGRLLAATGVDVVELRAAVVLGSGSISFEMLRYLTERLPAMVCPRWVDTRLQPIAERDLLDYLVQAMAVPAGVYEIGGPQVTTYAEMIGHYAAVRRLRPRLIVKVPLLTPSLSARWVDFVSPVDRSVSHALIESLTAEVVVRRADETARHFDVEPLGVAEAIALALDEQAERIPSTLFAREEGLFDGVYTVRVEEPVDLDLAPAARSDLDRAGGDLSWYGTVRGWRLRLALGRLLGERVALHRPLAVEEGAAVDWWTVRRRDASSLVLATTAWFCGEAWLGYRVAGPGDRVELVGALRPRGLPGFLYWRVLRPVHAVVFRRMARHRVVRARRLPPATAAALSASGRAPTGAGRPAPRRPRPSG